MSNVRVVITTKDAAVSAGTSDTPFVYNITASDGSYTNSQSVSDTTCVFQDVPPGTHIVTVSKMGYSVAGQVTILAPTVTLQVPDTVTVTVE